MCLIEYDHKWKDLGSHALALKLPQGSSDDELKLGLHQPGAADVYHTARLDDVAPLRLTTENPHLFEGRSHPGGRDTLMAGLRHPILNRVDFSAQSREIEITATLLQLEKGHRDGVPLLVRRERRD